MRHPRTIFLLQNTAGRWFVRTGASNGEKISSEEDHPTRQKAERAFIAEGRHQPHAHMVLIIEGRPPVVIRASKGMPEIDPIAEKFQQDRIRAAMALTKGRTCKQH